MKRILDVPVVGQLSPSKRKEIESTYYSAVDELEFSTESEYEYINSKIYGKVERTTKSCSAWVCKMARGYDALHKALLCHQCGELDLTPYGEQLVVAAVFYFVNPFDVIPDFTPGIGYLDDYYVLTLCLGHFDVEDSPGLQALFDEAFDEKAE